MCNMLCKLFATSIYMTQWRKSKKNQEELTYSKSIESYQADRKSQV